MNCKRVIIGLIVLGSSGFSYAYPVAHAASSKGELLLQNTITAESGRVLALNAHLELSQGITRTLGKGSTGNDVRLLQQFLKDYGVYPSGSITGYFGPLTMSAVKRFQAREGLDSVGNAGPKTRARIREISRAQARGSSATLFLTATSSASTASLTRVALSSAISSDGSATSTSDSFASTTQNVYAVLSLAHALQTTEIGYIRYYDGSYVDSAVSHPSRNGLAYAHFQWSLKPGAYRLPGDYAISFYIQGALATTVRYAIK